MWLIRHSWLNNSYVKKYLFAIIFKFFWINKKLNWRIESQQNESIFTQKISGIKFFDQKNYIPFTATENMLFKILYWLQKQISFTLQQITFYWLIVRIRSFIIILKSYVSFALELQRYERINKKDNCIFLLLNELNSTSIARENSGVALGFVWD